MCVWVGGGGGAKHGSMVGKGRQPVLMHYSVALRWRVAAYLKNVWVAGKS